jgi:lipopolysaccharide export system protein LptC
MRKWSSALLPLSILLVLVALTTWLRYVTEFPEVRNDGRNRHDPDYIISDVRGAQARYRRKPAVHTDR